MKLRRFPSKTLVYSRLTQGPRPTSSSSSFSGEVLIQAILALSLMDPLHQTIHIQRVVLLIDLHPLVSSQNPNLLNSTSYFSPILASIRRILSSPQLASSLSALKFVFSTLSPVSSTSKTHHLLGKCPNSLSFNDHPHTLIALSETLQFISSNPDLSTWQINGASKASLLAKLLLQLENEFAWEAKRSAQIDQGLLRSGSNL